MLMDDKPTNNQVVDPMPPEKMAEIRRRQHKGQDFPFSVRNISVLAYAQGFTLWHYRAPTQPLSSLLVAGYFLPAADMFSPGDIILLSACNGGTVRFVIQTNPAVITVPLS